APFRPISPSTSPCFTSKPTSFSAQNFSFFSLLNVFQGARKICPNTFLSAVSRCSSPSRYCLLNPCARIARSLISSLFRQPFLPRNGRGHIRKTEHHRLHNETPVFRCSSKFRVPETHSYGTCAF